MRINPVRFHPLDQYLSLTCSRCSAPIAVIVSPGNQDGEGMTEKQFDSALKLQGDIASGYLKCTCGGWFLPEEGLRYID